MNKLLRETLIRDAICQNNQLRTIKECIDTQDFDQAKKIIDFMALINDRLITELTT